MKVAERYNADRGWAAVAFMALALALALIFAGCKDNPAQPPNNPAGVGNDPPSPPVTANPPEPAVTNDPPVPTDPPVNNTPPEPTPAPKVRLQDVIRNAMGWGPVFQSWNGKPAPDFTVTDLEGKKHKLSDYRGKDVMLVFWATWCRPCIVEIPHLIAFQKVVGKDKLAVLGISYVTPINSEQKIRSFVAQNDRINYTVCAADEKAMPEPYNMIQGIPSSFFIDPEGKIKLATSGLLSLGYMKAILQAE
jgi:peroxiredoxin